MKLKLESDDEDWSSGLPPFVFSMPQNEPKMSENGATKEPPEKKLRVKSEAELLPPTDSMRLKIMTELFHSMKEQLQCSVCGQFPRPNMKIYDCITDRKICKNCHGGSCVTMLHRVSDIAEVLLLKLPYQCKNVSLGCQEMFFADDLFDHEAKCQFRELHCVICAEKFSYPNYENHFMIRHYDCKIIKSESFKDKPIEDLIALTMMKPTRLDAFGYSFFETGIFKDGHIYRWISVLAPTEKSKKFSVIAKISDNHGNDMKRVMGVHSMSEDPNDIVKKEEDVFMFSTKTAASYGKLLYYSIEIQSQIVKLKL